MAFFTRYWILDSFTLVFGLIALLYLFMTRKFKYWKNRGVPEIPPTAFVGNVGNILIKKNIGDWAEDLYKKSSGLPYVGFFALDRPCLLIRDPKLIKHVLVKDFNYFNDRFVGAGSHDRIGDANLFLIKNPQWKLVRTKLTPIYTSGKLRRLFELIDVVGDDLLTLMESLNLEGDGQEMEMKELSARYITDTIATTAFGIRANCLNNSDAEFREIGRTIFENSYSRNLTLIPLIIAPQFLKPLKMEFVPRKTSNFLRTTLWEVIEERERLDFKRGDLVDVLIELRNKKNEISIKEFDFDGDNLVAQAVVFFIAGFETSSTVLSFMLYELALHPKVQQRLRTEILEKLSTTDGKVTYDMATNFPYLDMVIFETLRKYPPLPALDRVAKEDYKFPDSNFVLEKGTPIMISLLGLHYNPEYFPNPDVFDPERFSETNKKSILPYTYLPFGEGPHNCIGSRIGFLQVKIALIKLLPRYEFSPSKKTAIPMCFSKKAVLTAAERGVFVQVKKL